MPLGFPQAPTLILPTNLQRLFHLTQSSPSILFFSVTYLSFSLHSAFLISSFSFISVFLSFLLCFCLLSFSFSHLSLTQPGFLSGSQQEKKTSSIRYTFAPICCPSAFHIYTPMKRGVRDMWVIYPLRRVEPFGVKLQSNW